MEPLTALRPRPLRQHPLSHGDERPTHPNIREFADYHGPIVEHCDFLIIGSGPGGASLAKDLIRPDRKVILLEAGPWFRSEDHRPDGGKSLASYFWDSAMRFTRGNLIMPTLHARCLGGGSVVNAAICMRPSASQLERWKSEHGLDGLDYDALLPHLEAAERFLGVRPVADEVQGRRNQLFREACETLGWNATPLPRMEEGCVGSGECITGCRAGAKNSLDRRGIPEFVRDGGLVYTSVQATRLVRRGREIDGIEGFVVDPVSGKRSHPVRIAARATILAAGAVGSPALCIQSGITEPGIGKNLRFHPSAFVMGVFDEVVAPSFGATQGYHCLDFLEQGIKLESLWAPPSVFVRRFPGMGKTFQRYLGKMQHMAVWDCWISGDASEGAVRVLPGGQVDLTYDLHEADQRRLQEGNAKLAELFFAAGAKEILPGIGGLPASLRKSDDPVRQIRAAKLSAKDFQSGSNHVFGSMSMGADATRHATDGDAKVWGTENLYVADTSVFPTSISANPQLTAMALSHRLAATLHARY